jgi:GWxTD domain-containing protein
MQSNCARPIPKVLPESMESIERNDVPPYELKIRGDILDYSYVFSEVDFATKENYVEKAAQEVVEHILGPGSPEFNGEGVLIDLNFQMQQGTLTYRWSGELELTASSNVTKQEIFREQAEADFTFYRSVPDSSDATRYHIVFNTMAACFEKITPKLNQLGDLLQQSASEGSDTGNGYGSKESGTHPNRHLADDPDGFNQMSETELQMEYSYLKYISKKWKPDNFEKMPVYEKRKFLQEFWNQFRDTQVSSVNEFRRDYLDRVDYANRHFRGEFTQGWKTDRGRILLTYGKPDQIVNFPSNQSRKAYQVWHHNSVQNSVVFCFVDVRGTGEMKLVHSTADGELQNFAWFELTDPGRRGWSNF